MSKNYIAFWCGNFFPYALGGTFSAYALAKQYRCKNANVLFFTDAGEAGKDRKWDYEGFPVRAWCIHSGSKFQKLKGWLRCFLYFWFERKKFRVLHLSGASPWSLILGMLFKLVSGKPCLLKITLDGEDSIDAIRAGRHGWLASRLYLSLDAIVTMTSGQVHKLKEHGYRGEIRTIPNGVDCQRFRPLAKHERDLIRGRLNIPRDSVVLCYAGYLGERKGTDILLGAFVELTQRYPGLHLVCAGNFSPTYEADEDLKKFCRENGVDPGIVDYHGLHRFGRVDDMECYMGASDIFLFPSRREGFGTVQIEAMACGLSCVVNYLPGVTEDIYPVDSVGVVLKDPDPKAWAEAIAKLIEDAERREQMGQAARKLVEEHFSIESVADRYLELYGELERKSCPPTHKATEDLRCGPRR